MALVTQLVPDLERLTSVETMYLKRLKLRLGERDYSVSSDTEELYHLRELERELSTVAFGAQPWYFVHGLIPKTGEEAFLIRRAASAITERLEVFMGEDILMNLIRQKVNLFKTIIHIKDPMGEMVLRVKGQSDTKYYVLQTKEKTTIGSIFRVTCKSPEEWYPHLDEYVMRVPAGLSVDLKVAVIAVCFLIEVSSFAPY